MFQTIRFALRQLVLQPAFAVVAIAALALGIGANAAIFSVLNAVLLQPLPFRDPGSLVIVWERNIPRNRATNVASPANFLAWRDVQRSFEDLAAVSLAATIGVTGGSAEPEQVGVQLVSAQLFPLLGVRMVAGRPFTQEEDRPDSDAIVISHRLWLRRFGGDPGVVGRTVTANGRARTIVGVVPADFTLFDPTVDAWMPIGFDEAARQAGGRWLFPIGRLKPGVTLARAQAEMDTITTRLAAEFPDRDTGWASNVVPVHEQLVGSVRPALLVLGGAVGFVLLIACANVGNLLLVRATARQRELAVRAALGAGRRQLAGQLFRESLVLAAAGAVCGLLLAHWSVQALVAATADRTPIPRLETAALDWRVLAFTLVVSLVAAIAFGLTPALFASRPDLHEALKDGARSSSGRGGRLRAAFVVVEVALALVLLAGAGLLLRSFRSLVAVDPGFRAQRVLTLQVSLPSGGKYADDGSRVRFFNELFDRLGGLPGVAAAGGVSFLPLDGLGAATRLRALDKPEPLPGQEPVADVRIVSGDYFRAMGIPLRRGRTFTAREAREPAPVAVIGEAMARELWPGEDPIGKRFVLSWDDPPVTDEVIGVVGDVRYAALDTNARAIAYLTHPRTPYRALTLTVRTSGDPASITSAVVGQIHQMDPEQPAANIRTMEDVVSRSVGERRLVMLLLALFAGLALVLAALGLYGVLAYVVSRRTREIGIRVALGASPPAVLRLVVGQAMGLTLVGLAVGLAGAGALTRLMRNLLYDVSPTDPLALAGAAIALAAVGLAASVVPALRALRVDPVVALRTE
jgi:putative ABC transport system permease protein